MPYVENEPLDLNTLHKRAGGTSETTVSMNDLDIMDLRVGSPPATPISFDEFAVSPQHTFTITTGVFANSAYGYSDDDATFGSISPDPANVHNIYDPWKIVELYYFSGLSNEPIYLTLTQTASGDDASNSGWEHLVINGNSYFRAEADDYNNTGASSDMQWVWNTDPLNASATLGVNPFGSSGDSITVKIA